MQLFAVFGKVCVLYASQCIKNVLIGLDLWFLPGRHNVKSINTTAFSVLSLIKQSKFQRLQEKGSSCINYVQCEQGCAVQIRHFLSALNVT